MTTLLVATLAGLAGMLGWGLVDFFAKTTIDRLGDVETLFWGQLIGILPVALLFFISPTVPALSILEWAFLVVLGVWSGLSYIPTYVAFGKGQVSLLSPIFASYAVVVAIIAALFLGEVIPLERVAAFAIVFAGVLLISGDPRVLWRTILGSRAEPGSIAGLPEIALATLLYSLWLVALDRFVHGRNWVPLLLGIRVFSTLAVFAYARIRRRVIPIPGRALWKYLVPIGLFDVAAFAAVSFGYSATPYVSVITMLSGAFSLPTIVLARLFLHERATRLQKAGSLLVIAGVMLLPFA